MRNFHAPQNSFISDVLNDKKGNPLSLSLLYLIIAQKCELPIKGVNLPKHFVIAYTHEELYEETQLNFILTLLAKELFFLDKI